MNIVVNPEGGINGNLLVRTGARIAAFTWEFDDDVSNSIGRLTGYDRLGRVLSSEQKTEATTYPFTYTYNKAGGLESITYPSARTVKSCYDVAGRVIAAQDADTGSPYASLVSYHPHGAVQQLKLGNDLWEYTGVDAQRLWPTDLRLGTSPTASDVWQQELTYSPNGNVETLIIHPPGLTNLEQSFLYDGASRLTSAEEKQSATTTWSRTYDYGAHGNRALASNAGLGTSPVAVGPGGFNTGNNRVAAANGCTPATINSYSWCYDEAGNLLKNGLGEKFTYDAENRQLSYYDPFIASTTTYAYDGDGRRVKKISPTGQRTVFVYDAFGQLAAEYSEEASTASGTHYRTADHLGSTRLVTDQEQNEIARYDYTPFGELIPDTVGGRNGLSAYSSGSGRGVLFTGKERDAETGLDYFGARYMSAAQGRFTSPDPFSILQEAGSREELDGYLAEPQRWNKYAYSLNNPLAYVDPDGKNPMLMQLMQRLSPFADKAAAAAQRWGGQASQAASRYGQQAYVWATQLSNSPTGQEVAQTVAETALGYRGPRRRRGARAIMEAMATIHMSEAEVARDLHAVLAKVQQGVEVVIEQDHRPIAVLKSSVSARPGRKLSECIALAKAYEAKLGYAPIPDEDFAKDVQAGIDSRRDSFEPPAWD